MVDSAPPPNNASTSTSEEVLARRLTAKLLFHFTTSLLAGGYANKSTDPKVVTGNSDIRAREVLNMAEVLGAEFLKRIPPGMDADELYHYILS
jgi:hypothetical protein